MSDARMPIGAMVHMNSVVQAATVRHPKLCRLCAALLVWMAAAGAGVPVVRAAEQLDEEYVKAAFIYNFAKFTQWPGPKAGALVIGVVGRDSINTALKAIAQGKVVSGREIVVRGLGKDDDVRAFHIIFIPASEERRNADVLGRVSGAAVLTVGESPHFLRDGGIVQFVIRENRVRFRINADAADHGGLKIGSQLLLLAKE